MHLDAIVIGGSFAGLSAATYIARARRSVCVIDTGLPRNRFAEHSHGFFSHDGSAPLRMVATAREQVSAYSSARFVDVAAQRAARDDEGFVVTLADGQALRARRLVLAYGLRDHLPDVPGLAERWGKTVIHCPYCHGFEFSGQRLGVLHVVPMSVHQAMLVAEWGPVTFYLNGADRPDAETCAELEKRGVIIEPARVRRLHGEGTQLTGIELEEGRIQGLDALYTGSHMQFNSDIAEQLGCELDELSLGSIIRTDESRQTTVPGVYAAGDIVRGAHSVTWACADGVTAGTALHRSLVF
ncbi:NAD(P)/FAD-dependent oxidoreductase [Dyella sp.]|uniref:NAD(P)/FAD-dependent oxidoreductase n=1 Tax=Dyella sp. TaxID=1869338 RepID=UPI002ED642DF